MRTPWPALSCVFVESPTGWNRGYILWSFFCMTWFLVLKYLVLLCRNRGFLWVCCTNWGRTTDASNSSAGSEQCGQVYMALLSGSRGNPFLLNDEISNPIPMHFSLCHLFRSSWRRDTQIACVLCKFDNLKQPPVHWELICVEPLQCVWHRELVVLCVAQVRVFGSFATGLYLPSSDVDVSVPFIKNQYYSIYYIYP